MRFGSVCSGIEAASVAWHPLGWKAAWLSEIEPFPSAVLAHHYPDVPNLGDMTALPERILSGEVEAPDLFCGGTPCQAFSVAGLRNSLDDARGNLSLTFVGIANAIDHVRSVRRDDPAIIFWENVPGVLSTKDNAFGCFLGALAGEVEALEPAGGKWTNAGCVSGPQRTVAWRVLDAQYFGVAQRRRRVFVVASARADFDPTAVLFEFDGMRRDTAPSRQARQDTATGPASGLDVSHTGTLTAGFGKLGAPEVDAYTAIPVISPCLDTQAGSNRQPCTQAYVAQPTAITFGMDGDVMGDVMETITTREGNISDTAHAVMQPIAWDEELNASVDVAGTLLRGGAGGRHDGVAQPMPINTMVALRHEALGRGTGFGIGEAGDPAYTLTKGHSHAVAQPVNIYGGNKRPDRPEGGFYVRTDEDTSKTLDAATGLNPTCSQGGTAVLQPMVLMDQGGSVMNVEHDMVGTLRRETHGHEPVVMQPMGFDAYNNAPTGDVAKTLDTGIDYHHVPNVLVPAMAVRRLTPVECERLQGFPDGYTAIPWRKKPVSECPDGPRYKALGNSWAVPVVAWIGRRIAKEAAK
jgi:DNA (cytosine-5)-methyltransferase 1